MKKHLPLWDWFFSKECQRYALRVGGVHIKLDAMKLTQRCKQHSKVASGKRCVCFVASYHYHDMFFLMNLLDATRGGGVLVWYQVNTCATFNLEENKQLDYGSGLRSVIMYSKSSLYHPTTSLLFPG